MNGNGRTRARALYGACSFLYPRPHRFREEAAASNAGCKRQFAPVGRERGAAGEGRRRKGLLSVTFLDATASNFPLGRVGASLLSAPPPPPPPPWRASRITDSPLPSNSEGDFPPKFAPEKSPADKLALVFQLLSASPATARLGSPAGLIPAGKKGEEERGLGPRQREQLSPGGVSLYHFLRPAASSSLLFGGNVRAFVVDGCLRL